MAPFRYPQAGSPDQANLLPLQFPLHDIAHDRSEQTALKLNLSNQSGATVPAYSVIILSTSVTVDNSFTTSTTVGVVGLYGVTLEEIPNGAVGQVAIAGFVDRIRVAAGTTRYQFLRQSATAGVAEGTAASVTGTFARALTSRDADGYCRAALISLPAAVEPDTTAPRLSLIVGNGTSIRLLYDEPLTVNTPTTSAFAVVVNGVGATESSVSVAGSVVTVVIATALVQGDTFTVAYTAGATPIEDLAGNDAANFAASAGTNITPDTTAPTVAHRRINGTTLVIVYNEALNTTAPAASTFVVKYGAATQTVSSITITGSVITLVIAAAAIITDSVTVAYTANGTNDLQDLAGNKAANYGDTAAVNTTTPATTFDAVTSAALGTTYWDGFEGRAVSTFTDRYASAATAGAIGTDDATGLSTGHPRWLSADVTAVGIASGMEFGPSLVCVASDDWSFKALMRQRTAPVGGTVDYYVGFRDASTSGLTDGIYFRSTNAANWFLICRSAGVETTVNMGAAPGATRQLLEFRITGDGTSVQGYLNNLLTGSAITTNIPTGFISGRRVVCYVDNRAATVTTSARLELWGWGLQSA